MSAFVGPTTYTNWQVPQFPSPNDLWNVPVMGEHHVRYAHMEDSSMQASLNQFRDMKQPTPALPAQSSVPLAEETEIPFQDINYLSGQVDFVEVGGVEEPVPTLPCNISGMQGTGEIPTYHPDMNASFWQADLHSYENWLEPISMIPDDTSGVISTGTAQESYPDEHPLVGQAEFDLFEDLLAPTSAIPGDFSGTLRMEGNPMCLPNINTIPMQPAFSSHGTWPEPALMASGDLTCKLGTEEYQSILFPDMAAPQMQGTYLPSGNLQGQEQEPTEPENFPTQLGMENTQAFQDPGALSGGFDSYSDELWRTAVATEPGGFEEFLFSDPVDLTIPEDFPELEAPAPGNPSGVVGMGDHQAHKYDEGGLSEQPNLPSIEAIQEPEPTNPINQFSFLGTGQHEVSPDDREISSGQPAVRGGEDDDMVPPKAQDVEDAQQATLFDMPSLFGSDDGEWIDPDEYLTF